ncbi:MAG: glycosyltransferase family 4 protein [Acidimicrobiia bacterium]
MTTTIDPSGPAAAADDGTGAPRIGFVLEQTLGHVSHSQNLQALLSSSAAISAEWLPIAFDMAGTDGPIERLPLYRNWTVRAGLRARRAIAAKHKRQPLDGLFIHTQVPAVLCRSWMRRLPTVVSIDATPLQYDSLGAHYAHETGNARVEKAKHALNRQSFERATGIVAWSEWAKAGVVDGYGIDPAKVTVIAPGVHYDRWARDHIDSDESDPVRILFVGGDLVRKGGDLLLDAFRQLRSEGDGLPGSPQLELHLVTATDVPAEPGVFVHHGVRPNTDELKRLFHAASIFCLPTRGDCLPMVLAEAGACALPLVSTDVGAISEVVRNGETGMLLGVDDGRALADALRHLVTDRAARRSMGAAAQALVHRDHDAATNAGRLTDLLRAVVDVGPYDSRRSGAGH